MKDLIKPLDGLVVPCTKAFKSHLTFHQERRLSRYIGASIPSTTEIQSGGRHVIAWGESANPRKPHKKSPKPRRGDIFPERPRPALCRPSGAPEFGWPCSWGSQSLTPGYHMPRSALDPAALNIRPSMMQPKLRTMKCRVRFVPLSNFMELEAGWDAEETLADLEAGCKQGKYRLPPADLGDGAAGVIKNLRELGLFYRIRDGREYMPEVFRFGFGLKQKGGIRPAGSRA